MPLVQYGLTALFDSPVVPLLTLAEAKLHLRVDFDDDDDLIANLVDAAAEECESWCNAAFVPKAYELTLAAFPYRPWHASHTSILLPIFPLLEVTAISCIETGETEYGDPIDAGDYVVVKDSRRPFIALATGKTWPSTACHPQAVKVEFRAGFEQMPPSIISAVKLRIAQLYRMRDEPDVAMSPAVMAQLSKYRMHA